jgi:hypothetical protein
MSGPAGIRVARICTTAEDITEAAREAAAAFPEPGPRTIRKITAEVSAARAEAAAARNEDAA